MERRVSFVPRSENDCANPRYCLIMLVCRVIEAGGKVIIGSMTSLKGTFNAPGFHVYPTTFATLLKPSRVTVKSTTHVKKGESQEQTYMVLDRRFCEVTVFSYL